MKSWGLSHLRDGFDERVWDNYGAWISKSLGFLGMMVQTERGEDGLESGKTYTDIWIALVGLWCSEF